MQRRSFCAFMGLSKAETSHVGDGFPVSLVMRKLVGRRNAAPTVHTGQRNYKGAAAEGKLTIIWRMKLDRKI